MYRFIVLLSVYFCGCQGAVEEKPKSAEDKTGSGGAIPVEVLEVKVNPKLQIAVFEVKNYLRSQERREKFQIFEICSGKELNGQPTLFIELSNDFQKMDLAYRKQAAEGFYQFWKLRSLQNDLGANVVLKLIHNGAVVGIVKDGKVVFSVIS